MLPAAGMVMPPWLERWCGTATASCYLVVSAPCRHRFCKSDDGLESSILVHGFLVTSSWAAMHDGDAVSRLNVKAEMISVECRVRARSSGRRGVLHSLAPVGGKASWPASSELGLLPVRLLRSSRRRSTCVGG
jgi:hypothetical protein